MENAGISYRIVVKEHLQDEGDIMTRMVIISQDDK
jgi:hypothetical protein